ncbi:MAG: hypothetical protein MZV70_07835 [Desulfobacterales bacterium]|nr:hypothetical protein [Desulfobacterales bacterium]
MAIDYARTLAGAARRRRGTVRAGRCASRSDARRDRRGALHALPAPPDRDRTRSRCSGGWERPRGAAVVVSDLRRTRLGAAFTWAGCRMLSRSDVFRVDGMRSVAAAFTTDEARSLAAAAGLGGAHVSEIWPQRWLLTWRIGVTPLDRALSRHRTPSSSARAPRARSRQRLLAREGLCGAARRAARRSPGRKVCGGCLNAQALASLDARGARRPRPRARRRPACTRCACTSMRARRVDPAAARPRGVAACARRGAGRRRRVEAGCVFARRRPPRSSCPRATSPGARDGGACRCSGRTARRGDRRSARAIVVADGLSHSSLARMPVVPQPRCPGPRASAWAARPDRERSRSSRGPSRWPSAATATSAPSRSRAGGSTSPRPSTRRS